MKYLLTSLPGSVTFVACLNLDSDLEFLVLENK